MKLNFFLILFAVLQVSASVSGQNTRFDLKMKNATISQVFDEIERQSEVYFFYNKSQIDESKTISVDFRSKTIDDILKSMLSELSLTYEFAGKNIIIKPAELQNNAIQQQKSVSGKVTDSTGSPLPGVSVLLKGTTTGIITDSNGNYSLSNIPENATLQFSFIGMKLQEITVGDQTTINIKLTEETVGIDEVVVIGYGVQKRSDYTGSVASLSQERLEMVPNQSIAQAIQGAMAGVMMQTSSAGSNPNEVIMIRGRNSILASNDPLIVLDGIPYGGQLKDINPSDIKSIEILKDASAAAIYGSRGANGVILVTSKLGIKGSPQVSYDGYYSSQSFTNIPRILTGEEFYKFKMEREPKAITQSEKDIYESGKWVDWMDLALRNGSSQKHNLSVAGGYNNTQYYISGGVSNVKGLALNDQYLRLTSSINLNSEIRDWMTIGTRTQFSYDDSGGLSPSISGDRGAFTSNPLTTAYDENGSMALEIWPEEHSENPLMNILATNMNESYQLVANNYAIVKIPFIPGLQYRINTGIRIRLQDIGTYYGRDTKYGRDQRGNASTNRILFNNYTIENIVDYNRDFGKHNLFITGVYSYETTKSSSNSMTASGFPHDFLLWYSAAQADLVTPGFNISNTALISQMLRFNYSYDSRYLLTLTGRRDGYSGFGAENKWGMFPSMALGWNIASEKFFPFKKTINEMKFRISYGLNGNQAVGPYETISRLGQKNIVAGAVTLPGYIPSQLGQDNLGWESTESFNVGLDFGILSNRVVGDINLYRSRTSDLLLRRTISAVHGPTSITQNIGETENKGMEISITSKNVAAKNFKWVTTGNLAFNKNQIVSLYGNLDDEGNEVDDLANSWFIGQPIRVNYGYVWGGVWQLDEAEEAARYGSQPGYVKIKDITGDTLVTTDDRQILGQKDPKFMWGMSNSWSYKSLTLTVFMHGVHGITKELDLINDQVSAGVTRNTTWKNWWTPENPTNDWYKNTFDASHQNGIYGRIYEKADFIRIKDITLSYDLANNILKRIGFSKAQIYATGRNLITITKWRGLDPELDGQTDIPLQKEYVFGLNLKL